jgi:hypothetical protein
MVGLLLALDGFSPTRIGQVFGGLLSLLMSAPSMFVIAPGIVAINALVPTIIIGFFAVRTGVRSLHLYVVMGTLVGLAGLGTYYALVRWADSSTAPLDFSDPRVMHVVTAVVASIVVAGSCGGLIFWAIAGRHIRGSRTRLQTVPD